jgi:hemoglobin
MKKAIEGPEDVAVLVRAFYTNILKDDLLAPFFKNVAENKWEYHLEVMNRFWNNILFYSGDYVGNPFKAHQIVHLVNMLQPIHFQRWEKLFAKTVDELFTGPKAEQAKQRTLAISSVMQEKILQRSNGYAEL